MVERNDAETYGMGTIIISPHKPGYVMAIEELVPKAVTNRRVGDLSVPLETEILQNGTPEPLIQVVRASLAEVMNDGDLVEVGSDMSLVSLNERYISSKSSPGVSFRTSVVAYSGDPDYPFTPTVQAETVNPHWVPVKDFIGRKDVRPLAREVVIYSAFQRSLLEERAPTQLFPQGFSLTALQQTRDRFPDRILERAS